MSEKNITRKADTDKNGKQESQQFQCCADVVEVRLLALDSDQNLVEPGELQVRIRPNVGTQCLLEYRHTATGQQICWRTGHLGRL